MTEVLRDKSATDLLIGQYAVGFVWREIPKPYLLFLRKTQGITNLNRLDAKQLGALNPPVDKPESPNPLLDWRNVGRHCVIEAIQVDVIASRLGLSKETAVYLKRACFIHDSCKRKEVDNLIKADTPDAKVQSIYTSETTEEEVVQAGLREQGISDIEISNVVEILQGVGLSSLMVTHNLLERVSADGWNSLSEIEKAKLIIHIVDDITESDRIVDFEERTANLYRNPKKLPFVDASRDFARREFGKLDLLTIYGASLLGEKGLRPEEFEGTFPPIFRVLEVIGIRARRTLATAIGLEEKDLNQYIKDQIFARANSEIK